MTDAERSGWDDAEAIATAYVRAREPEVKIPIVERHRTIPYLFSVRMTTPTILVFSGAVIEARGMPALRAYLHDSQLFSHPYLPDVLDMQYLLTALDAWPPTQRYDRKRPDDYWRGSGEYPLLHPRLERKGTTVELHLFYMLSSSGGPAGSDVADPDKIRVAEWILIVEAGMDPLWTRRERIWSDERDGWAE